MASWGGHTLPGTFFIIFGIFYAFKYSRSYLKRSRSPGKKDVFYCCKGRIPFSGIVIEGIIKIVFVSIGILVELFYPGAPMGHLHNPSGQLTHPMNWQHATMYFFFGLSGAADILSYSARHILPQGFDRLFGSLALFVEGYLFFFHLHGRSHIDTRVHILLVLSVWPGSLAAFLQCFVMNKRKLLHIFEMLTATLLILQGTWFWQAAYILYPPDGNYWDPCHPGAMHKDNVHSDDNHTAEDCNSTFEAELNMMFITMFWSWHVAAVICFVATVYTVVYQYLKCRGKLDPSFQREYESLNDEMVGRRMKFHAGTPLNGAALLRDDDDDEEDEI